MDQHEPLDSGVGVLALLDCGDDHYDANSTAASIAFSVRTPLPHGWSITGAIAHPLSTEWHRPVLDWMAAERYAGSADPQDTYLKRLAVLVWLVYMTAPWNEANRKGAAYALLLRGISTHRFTCSDHPEADNVLRPTRDFFERIATLGGVTVLAGMLQLSFVPV